MSAHGWVGRWALVAGLSACGGGEVDAGGATAATAQAYTGVLASSDARIALVEQGAQVRAYVCGGPASYGTMSRWFTLTRSAGADGGLRVQGVSEGWSLEGELRPGGGDGWLRGPDGVALSWQAHPVATEAAGLYELRDELGVFGAIVEAASGQAEPEVQGTLLARLGYRAQVTPVRPVVLPSDLRVLVSVEGQPQVRRLSRVEAGP